MLIDEIYVAMKSEPGYLFVDPEEGCELQLQGLAELNNSIVNDYGAVAARLTPSGVWLVENKNGEIENMAKVASAETTTTEVETPATFEITKGGFEAPKRKQFSRKSKFPFDALEVGDSFLIAGKTSTEIASTITAANKRFSEETGETETYTFKGQEKTRPVRTALRKFAAVDEDGGVRVGRVS